MYTRAGYKRRNIREEYRGIRKNTQYTNITESTTRKSYTNSKQDTLQTFAILPRNKI
jgi:hypothetical protein